MTVKLSLENSFTEKVHFKPYGQYSISSDGSKDTYIQKTLSGKKIQYGHYVTPYDSFDSTQTRKNAYGTSIAKIMGGRSNHNNFKITGSAVVKKYSKNKKKRN